MFKIKTLSTALTNAISGNSTRYYGKFSVEGKDYTTTLNNFKYNNIINPNNDISLGNTCASSVTFSIYMPQVSLENKEITIYEGVKIGSNIEYIKLGVFIIDKQESDGEYTKYTGYDRMYKADMPYFSELTYPSTDKAILQEICSQMNISLATNIAATHTINEKPNGYTRREMIGYMAMLQGGNAVINSDGNLVLKWYTDSGYMLDGHKYYQQGITFTTSKDFIIEKLTCNNTASGATEQSEITSGSGATGLTLSNPFMTQANLDEIYKKIGGFTFRPLTVKFIGDFRLETGDIITVSTKDGSEYKVPIMQIVHECDGGLMDTITSIGQSDTENGNIASGPMTKQMERYYADLVLLNKAIVNKLDVDEAKINYATIKDLNATKATIEELDANKLSANYAEIINANVKNLEVVNADITNLKTNSLTAETADIRYAQIDFANVKGQVIGTSLIKDGAVTNEKVQSLSANKLTAGIIDASKITVTNLNADNLTVGTINGKLIGKGSVDLNKLSQEVPTKEYLDKVQEDLQGQIDGNIETFTKTEIPTLNNEPAINWKDNTTRKKHIGDICYVVNPQSSADGYSYRFANTGTETAPVYEWVLIKDSDVTKALQDIININGEITGIKSFNVEISSWKTDTDEELSSLKARTTTLETDIGNKVSTTVFNEVKQTVDENSSNITKMSETLSKKADSSTVESLTTTVNSIKQTAEGNAASISSLTKTVTTVEETANNASATAGEAKTAASNAEKSATSSASSASSAASSATRAETAATNSANSASSASSSAASSATSASNAEKSANNSATSASEAKKLADTANTNASNAVSTANTAKATADTAKKTADSANTAATNNAKEITTIKSNYNTISQTVNSNTATIKELSTTLSKKADSSTVEEVSSKTNEISQTLDSLTIDISSKLSNIDGQLNGDFKIYNVTEAPTKDNFPANNWFVPVYPGIDKFPDENTTWSYSNEEYAKHNGAVAYNANNGKLWRWYLNGDTWEWREISNSESAYTLNQNTSLKLSIDSISSELNTVRTDITSNYLKTTDLATKVAQEINNDNASIISALSGKYVTTDYLTANYSTTAQMNNAITQAVTAESNSIKLEVSNTYATKNSLDNYSTTAQMDSAISTAVSNESAAIKMEAAGKYVTTENLKSYATSASLDLYIKKDPKSGELKSAIEAIAEDITLKAAGSINISGNKSVNISGNLFTVAADNLTITADGKITCKDANLQGTFKNISTSGDYTLTTTIQGGEYRIANSDGSYIFIQGHLIELSKEGGTEKAIQIGRHGILDNGFLTVEGQTSLNGNTFVNTYSNFKIYHPSIKRYMNPALCATNPITFEWSGDSLFILVDNTIVATWNWGEQKWY